MGATKSVCACFIMFLAALDLLRLIQTCEPQGLLLTKFNVQVNCFLYRVLCHCNVIKMIVSYDLR